jgi:hypothetical protein
MSSKDASKKGILSTNVLGKNAIEKRWWKLTLD